MAGEWVALEPCGAEQWKYANFLENRGTPTIRTTEPTTTDVLYGSFVSS